MVYVIQVCWWLPRKLSANLYVLLCVKWKTPDDGQRNCPKHVEVYSKNKFEKLVYLVGFIVRIYRNAWSPEHKKCSISENYQLIYVFLSTATNFINPVSTVLLYSSCSFLKFCPLVYVKASEKLKMIMKLEYFVARCILWAIKKCL